MGKVKIKVIGDEQQELEQKEEQKKKREERASAKGGSASGGKKAQVSGVNLGGGERIQSLGLSEEDAAKELDAKTSEETTEGKKEEKKSKRAKAQARIRSKRHTENSSVVGKNISYPVGAGIELLRKFKKSNFDETVELHVNTKEKGISGQVTLPHGTGKKLRIVIATDEIIAEIEKGKINFDVLVATPDLMPKLARVARVLSPRGLMPNPKNGTISDKPNEVVEKLSAGQISYKTEAQAPVIHMSVGKLSFDDKMLSENIDTAISSIGPAKITGITLKSTMSPAVRLAI